MRVASFTLQPPHPQAATTVTTRGQSAGSPTPNRMNRNSTKCSTVTGHRARETGCQQQLCIGGGKREGHFRTGLGGIQEERCGSTLSLTTALDAGGRSTPRPGRFIPGMTRYPLYRGLGGPHDRQARSEFLYRLGYPGHIRYFTQILLGCCYRLRMGQKIKN
jgi:hypothetical protein